MFWIKVLIFWLGFRVVATQRCCVSFIQETQCPEGEICTINRCEDALNYSVDFECAGSPSPQRLRCVSDYCQPDPSLSTAQCVHGQVCSYEGLRKCVYPVVSNVEEGSEITLAFQEPATPGSYEEIQWYKERRSSLVAVIHPVVTDNKPQYYNELCPDTSPCGTSDRANLNISTGELTIHRVELSDEGFYYYQFYNNDGSPDTGVKYKYRLNVYVLSTLTIEGVPSEQVEVGTYLSLTCTVDRIKPLALGMYWVVHGRNESGALSSTWPDMYGVYTQNNTYMHVVTKEDKSVPIRCGVVPVYGNRVEVKEFIKPGYAPFGTPTVEVSGNDHYEGEKVTLTCTNPVDDGNPPCNSYIWTRLEGNSRNLPIIQIYTFIMDQLHAGNYTCQCSNMFGSSLDSEIKEIPYFGKERPQPEKQKDNGGLIAGCVIGVLILVALVVAAVFFCKKYRCNIHIQSGNDPTADKGHQEMDGYENPVNNSVNPVNNSEYEELSVPPTNEPENIPNEYQYIDDQEENQVNSNVNPEPENRPNEYHYIDVGAMDRTGVDGYMNPAITTYGDGL